jgi:hypothetical protein
LTDKLTTRGSYRVKTNLRNEPIENTPITGCLDKDAYGLLPSSVVRLPCWAAFQNPFKIFILQVAPLALDVLIFKLIRGGMSTLCFYVLMRPYPLTRT